MGSVTHIGARLDFELRKNLPVTTMGVLVTSANMHNVATWCGGDIERTLTQGDIVVIRRPYYTAGAKIGDYVIRRPDQKFYVVSEMAWKSQYYSETQTAG